MYSLEQVRRGLGSPKLVFRELNRLYYTRFRSRSHNVDGVDVFDADWDTLLILDACRYDTFAELYEEFDLPGTLSARESKGAATPEFVRANMDGRDLTDTVYVTATTMLYRENALSNRVDLRFHDVVDVWADSIDAEDFGTRPETMADRAREVHDRYPHKRVVVHFIQPHVPFLGPTGQEQFADHEGPIWRAKMAGDLGVDDETLWRAYRENLEAVLPAVADLMAEIEGRTVVTADHGQMIGDRAFPVPIKEYGHPTGIYAPELVRVPWLVNERGDRREVRADPAASPAPHDPDLDEGAREHLRSLGYVD